MSTFNPPPTNNKDNCRECASTETCFLYSTGKLCQPFTPPDTYPPPDTNNTLANPNPPGWYFSSQYPSLRYTGSLTNQTQGANCTTIPIPANPLFTSVANDILRIDQGGALFTTYIDGGYPTSLMQYRGNCAENFYCQPTAQLPDPTPYGGIKAPLNAQGSLPGTCQPVKAISQPCEASSQCRLWHIASDGSYDNDQNRCQGNFPSKQEPNGTFRGTCESVGAGKGNIYSDGTSGSYLQRSARVYLLASLFLICLMFVYMWYRRQKLRQQQMQYYAQTGLHPSENPALYSSRGGVNRRPDETDGELPSYGMHRRDERVTGPAAEEIGMYSFRSEQPGGPPTPGAGPVYPYPVAHPALTHYPPAPAGALYPPPQGPPPTSSPALTPQQVEAAAISAAAAAALPALPPAATSNLQDGGLLPPSYDATAVPTSQPSAVSANTTGNNGTNTASATGAAGADGEKPSSYNPFLVSNENSPRGSFVGAEKSAFGDEQDAEDTTIPDQASASSGSGSGTGPFSTTNATKPPSGNKETKQG
ncbi:hypothetical protein KI688_006148 [Linnemannia hyalina]|uniref:Uncharacterized protein n=1 Tax=Linnemannia hyalina TaxID=64524 RepID=A0A9P7Y253_9FUNG|nr:hypothetical protein KI688_006148 [Linnemannia hyalina]